MLECVESAKARKIEVYCRQTNYRVRQGYDKEVATNSEKSGRGIFIFYFCLLQKDWACENIF